MASVCRLVACSRGRLRPRQLRQVFPVHRTPSPRPRVPTSLPGAPDGEYRVFQFDTSFEHKQTAVETVTAVLETDGSWRIAGYFIR